MPSASRPRLRALLWAAVVAFPLLVVPISPFAPQFLWTAPDSSVGLATFAATFAIVAYSVGILIRFLDLASGAYAGLFGVGAYASGLAMERLDLGFWGGLAIVVLTLTLLGAITAAVTLRTTGIAFIIATLAAGELFVIVLVTWEGLTGGVHGLFSTKPIEVLPGVPLDTPLAIYLVALVFLALTIVASAVISRSSYGRKLCAIRDNEPLARSLGVNAFAYKMSAFVIAAVIAGVAGHLYFIQLLAITPELFHILGLITIFLMVIMGGADSLLGPLVGAWVVTFLPEWFEPLGLDDPNRQTLAFGVLLILFMLLAPAGIAGLAGRAVDRVAPAPARRRRLPELRVARALRLGSLAERVRARRDTVRTKRLPEAMRRPECLLEVEGLTRSFYAVRAVTDVSFGLRSQELLGIIGPNGSGKTTLLNCVSGFLRPDAGVVVWDGADITGVRPDNLARLGILRTFQERMTIGDMTPREHCELMWGQSPAGESPLSFGSVDEVLHDCDLHDVADTPASELSYGLLSNLALAAALSTRRARLLMLDEPAAGLSSLERGRLREQLLHLRDRGLSMVVVDHDMSFLMPMCDRIVVLDAGELIAEASPAEVQRDPRVVAAYLGERFAERAKSELGTVG